MKILTEKFSYGFIVFTIAFGIIEVINKVASPIPILKDYDIVGIVITVILSILLLFWELNKAVLSHYPTVLRLDDLGGQDYGISTQQLGQNGNPIEGSMIVMIRRRGKLKRLVRPKTLVIRIRTQFELIFYGGGSIILSYDSENAEEKDGFKFWLFKFADSIMEENTLGYSFKIRYPKNATNQDMPLEMYAIPNCNITLNYDFGFFKRFSFSAEETSDIQHG